MARKPDPKRPHKHLYDSPRWKRARLAFLAKHPLCEECQTIYKRITPATVVDHRQAHKGDLALFWSESNWAASCKQCHDTKTATMDGGFGNATKTTRRHKGCDEHGNPYGRDDW